MHPILVAPALTLFAHSHQNGAHALQPSMTTSRGGFTPRVLSGCRRTPRDVRLFQSAPTTLDSSPPTNGEASGGASPSAGKRSSSRSSSSFEKFDYKSHWYPVIWAGDLKPSRPTKVTLFDVDYAVAKLARGGSGEKGGSQSEEEEVVAMVDSCPHKAAALSEGRVTSCGSFQCAYHGWTFDSKTGQCLEIPQVEKARPASVGKKDRVDGTAVPAMIHQGMVWLFPYGGLEEALRAPPPPTVPEIDKEGFRVTAEVIRDFPEVDWTVLLENIMDPDHGLFAHQVKTFDFYSASKLNPQTTVEEELDEGKGWTITSTTDSITKLLERNDEMAGKKSKAGMPMDKVTKKSAKDETVKKATTTFVAPTTVYMGRRDPSTGETAFITAFWICPVGSGKSRFMSASVGKVPGWLNIPRWFTQVMLNNFVDQDTYLIATQSRHAMATESQLLLEQEEEDAPLSGEGTMGNVPVRRNLYAYRSPTEKMGAKIGSFFDATLGRVPGRAKAVRDMGGRDRVLNAAPLSREVVLDRFTQHTKICSDSLDVVRNCEKIDKAAKVVALLPVLLKVLFSGASAVTASSSFVTRALSRCNSFLSARPGLVLGVWIASAVASYLSNKLRKEFFFKYTSGYRERDMDKIPELWMDRL